MKNLNVMQAYGDLVRTLQGYSASDIKNKSVTIDIEDEDTGETSVGLMIYVDSQDICDIPMFVYQSGNELIITAMPKSEVQNVIGKVVYIYNPERGTWGGINPLLDSKGVPVLMCEIIEYFLIPIKRYLKELN